MSATLATTTAADVIDGIDLHGRRAVVTGAGSGIGVETARALAAAGADATLAVRDTAAGARVATRPAAELASGSGELAVRRLDLADRSTVAAFIADWQGPLHILVGNAGVMALPELTRTPDGRETQFAVNHLGHFALAVGLRPALAAADGARIVSVSSLGHLFSPVVFDDLDHRFRPYDAWTAYGQSKTANVLFAVGAAERWGDDGITANALMPGNIGDTSLARHMDMREVAEFVASGAIALPPQKTVEGITGRYFEDCAEAETVAGRDGAVAGRDGAVAGVAPYALDGENAAWLWAVSEDLTR
ncbi:SDR family NAD(P)-dependent oxidoreductase [Streptomyces monashensis]|uniref:SDR family NAD(P)-dependent oxidoreductase n=1 Tax=Streptomyces monashensis TaxID=1678012 RepID=UPI0033C2DF09